MENAAEVREEVTEDQCETGDPNPAEEPEMKKYVGIKMLEAEVMTLGEYNKYRGWDIPKNEDPDKEGYLVKYPDGYLSWSPKEQFEKAYLLLEDSSKITEFVVNEFMGLVDPKKIDDKTTLVSAKTRTGFVTHEVSSCVDPVNYDHEIGTKIATDRIRNKIWGHLGFVLQWAKYGLTK